MPTQVTRKDKSEAKDERILRNKGQKGNIRQFLLHPPNVNFYKPVSERA